MEMSIALISSGVGVRPIPNLGPCANADAPISSTNATGSSLGEPIAHAPVARDVPRLDAVVQPGYPECLVVGLIPVLGHLRARRLHLTELVAAARQDLCLVAVPLPCIAEPGMRHALRRAL